MLVIPTLGPTVHKQDLFGAPAYIIKTNAVMDNSCIWHLKVRSLYYQLHPPRQFGDWVQTAAFQDKADCATACSMKNRQHSAGSPSCTSANLVPRGKRKTSRPSGRHDGIMKTSMQSEFRWMCLAGSACTFYRDARGALPQLLISTQFRGQTDLINVKILRTNVEAFRSRGGGTGTRHNSGHR